MKVGLLECDHVTDQLRHIAGDYRQMFRALIDRHAPQIQLEYFDVSTGEFPASLNACDAYLTTGSRFSAYDADDWIRRLKDFVRQLRDADKPFVGICFGHQILAEALGGKVVKAEKGWGIGIQSMNVIQTEDWMRPLQGSCDLHYSHRDQVEILPEDSVVLGKTDHCRVAMFRVGERMLGIQGHPEFPGAYAEALIRRRTELIGADLVGEADFASPTDEAVITQWIAALMEYGG
jgi:GMP synthase-like glutamine amidotransferase